MNKLLYNIEMKFLNSKIFNKMLYDFTRSKMSKKFINKFIAHYNINTDELIKSPADYNSINDFFTRKIDMNTRPFDNFAKSFCSPCDGVISHIGKITEDMEFTIKNKPYSIKELLNRNDDALIGGDYALIYLSPANYHRFHASIDSCVIKRYKLGTTSEPVNDNGLTFGNAPIVKNYRRIEHLKTEKFNYYSIYVGAVNVNSIILHEKGTYKKGDEVGYFEFGSSILLLFPPNCIDITAKLNSKIKVGEKIAELI